MAIALGFSVETLLPINSKRLALARSLGRENAHARMPHDDQVPAADVDHGNAAGLAAVSGHGNAAVHLLIGDFDPVPRQAHLGALVRRAVKTLGECAVHVGWFEAAILPHGGHGPMVADLLKNLRQPFGRVGLHFHQGEAGIGARLPNRDLLDAKRPAQARDHIEHLGQDQAIDDVALDLDVFNKGGSCRTGFHGFDFHAAP